MKMVLDAEGDVLHSPGAAPVVAVVEVEALALEDECPEAILDGLMVSWFGGFLWNENCGGRCWRERERHTLAVEVVRIACTGILIVIAVGRTCSAVLMERS